MELILTAITVVQYGFKAIILYYNTDCCYYISSYVHKNRHIIIRIITVQIKINLSKILGYLRVNKIFNILTHNYRVFKILQLIILMSKSCNIRSESNQLNITRTNFTENNIYLKIYSMVFKFVKNY